jgi:hypothetical protein
MKRYWMLVKLCWHHFDNHDHCGDAPERCTAKVPTTVLDDHEANNNPTGRGRRLLLMTRKKFYRMKDAEILYAKLSSAWQAHTLKSTSAHVKCYHAVTNLLTL